MMAMLWAQKIILGKKTFAEVPRLLKEQVLEILQELYRGGTTILLITHDETIASTAKRVVRLSDGKIIADYKQEVDWE